MFRIIGNRIIIPLFLLSFLYSQQNIVSSEIQVLWLPQGRVLESLSGYGYSQSISGFANNISDRNPATLSLIEKSSLGISYQWDSKIEEAWFAEIGHERIHDQIPQSFSLVLPVKGFRIGYGFGQKYNSELLFRMEEIIGVNDQNDPVETFTPIRKTKVYSNSFILAFPPYEQFPVTLGIGYTINGLDYYEEIYTVKANVHTWSSNWMMGVFYGFRENRIFSVDYTSEVNFSSPVEIKYAGIHDTLGNEIIGLPPDLSMHFKLNSDLPARLRFGVARQLSLTSHIEFSVSNLFWHEISETAKNQVELTGNFVRKFSDRLTYSIGGFATDRQYTSKSGLNDNKNLFAVFLTGGLVFNWNLMKINVALADSHLMSGTWRKQTMAKVGLAVQL